VLLGHIIADQDTVHLAQQVTGIVGDQCDALDEVGYLLGSGAIVVADCNHTCIIHGITDVWRESRRLPGCFVLFRVKNPGERPGVPDGSTANYS